MKKKSTRRETIESWWLVQTSVDRQGNGLPSFQTEPGFSAVGFDENPVVTRERA